MQKTKASVPVKLSETPKQSPTQQPIATPEFPSMFSTPNRGSRASSVKPSRAGTKTKVTTEMACQYFGDSYWFEFVTAIFNEIEERLSVSNFASTPKSPQKSRYSRLDAAALDRGSPTAPVPTVPSTLGSGARTPSVTQSVPLLVGPPQTRSIYSINTKVPKSTPEGRVRIRIDFVLFISDSS